MPQRTNLLTISALALTLASIILTRVFKSFTMAEVLAVAAFLTGVALLVSHRRADGTGPLDWPRRLIVTGSVIGLTGLVVKLLFVMLGIGAGAHDMEAHEAGLGQRLLEHIHHLFFNIGFLFMIGAAIGMLLGRFRRSRSDG